MITYRGEQFAAYNKRKRTPGASKKFAVLAKDKADKVRLVRFGDPTMRIKKSNPKRRRSYCARSAGLGGLLNIFSANFWSRKEWGC